ncbi:MAG: glycoside hydrolase [Planctomycetes bacterium]|nr:glycoside hydrolase [Planctomycetota bacterium]
MIETHILRVSTLVAACAASLVAAPALSAEDAPVRLLVLPDSGGDSEQIDYEALPSLNGTHAVISPTAIDPAESQRQTFDLHHLKFKLHSYLIHHHGRLWCLWSEGPPIEDEPTQEVRYATSANGLVWSRSRSVTSRPEAPYAFIARGFWVRDGRLLALAAHFKGKGAFGADKELELRAYAWNEDTGDWEFERKLYDDAINNFPPQRLSSGDWILTRRDARFNVSVLIGGRRAIDDWQAFPVVGRQEVAGFKPDEPVLWPLPDGTLVAVYRDNGGSQRLFRSTSPDQGRTWTRPALTNFPNATSKLFSMRTSRGFRILISNANPKLNRREMHLSISRDGRTFTRMAQLSVPSPAAVAGLEPIWHKFATGIASVQYPHVIEHEGQLLIVLSRNKKQIELIRAPLPALDALLENSAE